MWETGQRRIGAVAAVAMTVAAVGAAELGALSPAMAAPAHGSNTFAKAYQKTVGEKSSDVSLNMNESVAGQVIKISATGAFNYAANEGHLTMNINLGSAGAAQTLQEVLANGQAYIQLPSSEQSLLGGKPWIAVPVGSGSSGVSGQSPTSALSLLQASASGVTKLGSASIDGVPTTEYRANVDPTKAASKQSPQVRKVFQQALSQFAGLHSVPVQVWIDNQNRIRRIKETVTLNPNAGSAAASTGQIKVATTVDLTNYGVPVTVTVPPPDQVSHQSLSQLGAGASSGGASTTS